MVKSEINFRGHAFSAKDEPLHLWFDLLHSQVQKMDFPPAWLATLALRWMDQTVIPIGGCVEPYLDEFVIDDGYIPVLLELSEKVLAELELLHQQGKEFVSLPDFGITVEPPRWNDASSRTTYLIAIGRAFQDLLAGRISETVDNPRPLDTSPYEAARIAALPPMPQTLLQHIKYRIDDMAMFMAFLTGIAMVAVCTWENLKAWFNNKTWLTLNGICVVASLTWLIFFMITASDSRFREKSNTVSSYMIYVLINCLLGFFIVFAFTLTTFLLTFTLSRF